MTNTQIWIAAGVAFYLVAMLVIGWVASKKVHNEKDYLIAGGRLGPFLSIGTLFATWFGAETCMGSSATAYRTGILGVIADPFGAGLCLIISGIFLAKIFHSMGISTIGDYFERRFGRQFAWIVSLFYVPVYMGWIGAQLLAFGYILNALTGLPLLPSTFISTVVVVIYTASGGMWADTLTDLFQGIVLIVGLLIIFPILFKEVGGFEGVRSSVPSEFFDFYPRNKPIGSWLAYFESWSIVGLGSLAGQDLFARIMAARSGMVARWSSIVSGIMYMTLGSLPVFLGIFARQIFPDAAGDDILIQVTLRYLSPPLIALFIGALLSAIMSTADSALLAPASLIGHNVLPFFKPNATDTEKLKVCQWGVPVMAALSLALAMKFQNIYTLCIEAWAILLTGFTAPLLAGVFWKRATGVGACAGVIVGPAVWIFFAFSMPEGSPVKLYGLFASACAVVLGSFWSFRKSPSLFPSAPH